MRNLRSAMTGSEERPHKPAGIAGLHLRRVRTEGRVAPFALGARQIAVVQRIVSWEQLELLPRVGKQVASAELDWGVHHSDSRTKSVRS